MELQEWILRATAWALMIVLGLLVLQCVFGYADPVYINVELNRGEYIAVSASYTSDEQTLNLEPTRGLIIGVL